MIFFRLYLLAGMAAHKVLWEVLKRRGRGAPSPQPSRRVRAVRVVKGAILLGLVVQTLVPRDVLPLASEPLALRAAGGILYTLGLLLAASGRLALGERWSDIEEGLVREEHAVVSRGVYRYLRHPIYVGDLLLLGGLELALNSWLTVAVLFLAPAVLYRAVQEERRLLEAVPGYAEYAARTKRFIPFVV